MARSCQPATPTLGYRFSNCGKPKRKMLLFNAEELVPEHEMLQMECGLGSEGRRREVGFDAHNLSARRGHRTLHSRFQDTTSINAHPSCIPVCRKEHRTVLSANVTAHCGITAAVLVACRQPSPRSEVREIREV